MFEVMYVISGWDTVWQEQSLSRLPVPEDKPENWSKTNWSTFRADPMQPHMGLSHKA